MDDLLEIKEVLAQEGRIQDWGNDWDSVLQSMQDRATGPKGFRLTRLQRDALENESFFGHWGEKDFKGKNLIIQAATSAGKTLLSELAVIDALAHGKKVLVLVPLKSMVKERYTQFERDFRDTGKKIYASSSDYQENDSNLIEGAYDVGILVYEKLFAMLCQPNCQILENCGLIVVDELTMMGMEARGPKLEVALEIAMQRLQTELRVVCLTTINCSVEYIQKWLNHTLPHELPGQDDDLEEDYGGGAEPDDNGVEVIEGLTRPVGLEENIITLDDGMRYTKHTPGENDEEDVLVSEENKPERFMELGKIHPRARQNRVVRQLLQNLAEENNGKVPRTLLFVPSQSGARREAKRLRKELAPLFPRHELDREFERALNECNGDSDMEQIKELARYGIAYHHSSMSYGLREVIEDNAEHLNLIVATETLTIGINLPFEVVIIADNKVHRGGNTPVALTQQEYKNIIGRAGRLGLCSRGKSYLLINSSEKERYTAATKPTRIVSALMGGGSIGVDREEVLAPFYLPQLIGNKQINVKTIAAIDSASLSRCCGAKPLDPKKMLSILEEEKLIERTAKVGNPRYKLTDQAEKLAPYAFSLYTTEILRAYFGKFDDPSGSIDWLEGIKPGEISRDRWLLDLLFMVCQDEEIKGGHTLDLAARNKGDVSAFRTKLRRVLEDLLKEPDVELLKNSQLEAWRTEATLDSDDYVTLFRVLAMYYWTRGVQFKEIEKTLNLRSTNKEDDQTSVLDEDPLFSAGDLERFAEVCSFHLEAASNLISYHYEDRKSYKQELYNLSCRVKYGMPRELTALASSQLRGIDRKLLLDLNQMAKEKEKKMTFVEYIYDAPIAELRKVISDRKRNLLIHQLEFSYYEKSREELQKKLEENAEMSRDWVNELLKLETIADKDNAKPNQWFQQLQKVLGECSRDDVNPLGMCSVIEKTDKGYYRWQFNFQKEGGIYGKKVQMAFLPRAEITDSLDLSLKDYFDPESKEPIENRVMIVQSTEPLMTELSRRKKEGREADLKCGCVLKNMNLIGLICSHVVMRDAVATKLLYETLTDLRGVISDRINRKIENYRPETNPKDPETVRYQLLLDEENDPTALLERLDRDDELKDYRVLPWGEQLENENADLPTVILLDRATIESHRSLYNYLYRHGHSEEMSFVNCRVLLDSEADKRSWNAKDKESLGMRWEGNNMNAWPEVCPDDKSKVAAIRSFLKSCEAVSYQVAISYAHYDDKGAYEPDAKTKIEWLQELVDVLNRCLNEKCVLFDGNKRASELFHGDTERAFAEYRKVPVGIVIYDQYYLDNHFCRNELQSMRGGEAGEKGIFYLQNGRISNTSKDQWLGSVTNSYLPDNQKDRDTLVASIEKKLRGD